MKNNDKKMLFGIGIVFLFLATVGFSYAYFSNAIANKDVKNHVVETGTLSLRYVDGAEIVMQNIKPGDTITKTVYVANTGTLDAVYNLVWQELTNEIENDEMLIEGTCTRMNATTEAEDGTCEGIYSDSIGEDIIKKKITIEPNMVHKYDITITFEEMDYEQNYNQGKKFSGVLRVREYDPPQFVKDSWATIANNVRNENISNYNIGDTKEIDLGDLGIHKVRIANTTTPEECSTESFSQTACGFVLEFEDIITTHAMNSTDSSIGGWPASKMYSYVNTDIYNKFPTDLKNVIIDTTVVSGHGPDDSSNFISTDKLYLLAPKEIYRDWSYSNDSTITRQLDYYNSKNVNTYNYFGAGKNFESTATTWWLRTASDDISKDFNGIYIEGNSLSSNASINYGVSPAFRIG